MNYELPWRVLNWTGSLVVSSHETHAEAVQMAHHLATLRAKLCSGNWRYLVRRH